MEKFSQEELRKFIDSKDFKYGSLYRGVGFEIYQKINLGNGSLLNLIKFNNGEENSLVGEDGAGCPRYIQLNNYLISLPSSTADNDYINFSKLRVYEIATGKDVSVSDEVKSLPKIYAGQIVVVDNKIIAISLDTNIKALCIVGEELRIIPLTIMEQLIRLSPLKYTHQKELKEMFSEEGWQFCNEMLINPTTLSVPCAVQFVLYKNKKRKKAGIDEVNVNIDFSKLALMLMRNKKKEEPRIKYIKTFNADRQKLDLRGK